MTLKAVQSCRNRLLQSLCTWMLLTACASENPSATGSSPTAGKAPPAGVASPEASTPDPATPVPTPPEPEPEPEPEPVVKKDPYQDQAARFMGGLTQLDTDSPFIELEKSDKWIQYKADIEKHWNHHETNRLEKMRTWQKDELSLVTQDELTMLYPLSGPDFLHANVLYPEATRYVMMALEDIDKLPAIEELGTSQLFSVLRGIDTSLRDIYSKGYFITQHMNDDLRANGVVPILMVFLARSGHEVLEVERQTLNSDAQLIPVEKWTSEQAHALRISFRNRETRQVKELVYFDIDIRDENMEKHPEFIQYIDELKPTHTFIKAGSYVLCCRHASTVRDAILKASQTLFQDDTGIPLRELDDESWNIQLYGEYAWPTKDFGTYTHQKSLMALYKSKPAGEIKTLPFLMGYHYFGAKKQNHMFVSRKAPATAP